MSFGIPELLIILAIIVLLFGTTKLKSLGSDLGSAIKGFRNAVTSDEESKEAENKEPGKLSGNAEHESTTDKDKANSTRE
ncbi:MAG: twin-arginine translocase TatA/TatE family subunit [Pseudomonadales bacterium]